MDTDTHHASHQARNHPEILNLIGEIDEFKGGWRIYQNLAPERLEALR
jgi:hypothetical protein